ncbi:hypothetical protein ScPMuIL_000671 [Solemya velum]
MREMSDDDADDVESTSVYRCNVTKHNGEGPHWDGRTNTLLFIDMGQGDVHRLNYITGEDDIKHFEDPVGFVVPRKSGGYIVGHGKKVSHFDWDSGAVSTLAEVEQGLLTQFNDAKCDASGRLWAGTTAKEVDGIREPERGSLYSLSKDQKITKHVDKISISNGVDWTDDNRTMYYIDSTPRQVWAYDFDISIGSMSNKRTVVDFGGAETMDTLGVPDGMTIDNNGHIWVACYGVGKVICFDPETGKRLKTLEFPSAKKTTSCCFGGPNMDELFVTSGTYNLTPEQRRTVSKSATHSVKVSDAQCQSQRRTVSKSATHSVKVSDAQCQSQRRIVSKSATHSVKVSDAQCQKMSRFPLNQLHKPDYYALDTIPIQENVGSKYGD